MAESGSYTRRWPSRGCVLFRLQLLVLLVTTVGAVPRRLATYKSCPQKDDPQNKVVNISGWKTTMDGVGSQTFSFAPVADDLRVVLTPMNASEDPDLRLYGRNSTGGCLFLNRAQDFGGELLSLPNMLQAKWNISMYHMRIICGGRHKNCKYHLSFVAGNHNTTSEEVRAGETRSGVAYHGVPLHYHFDCGEECSKVGVEDPNARLTISVWPRDASSHHHLNLLVALGTEPTTSKQGHMKTTRGWLSGEVVSTAVKDGRFYIAVLKKHGRTPMPFVLQVKMPRTLVELVPGRPTFGAVAAQSMAFYRFFVSEPNTDIEVYLTPFSGDSDLAVSHSAVHSHPTPLTAQWEAHDLGEEELYISSLDKRRQIHPTGWFHVGVFGYSHAAYSLLVMVEPHFETPFGANAENHKEWDANEEDNDLLWTELWLGTPQALSATPIHTAHLLFYNQLPQREVTLHVNTKKGPLPDVCVALCGSDVHYCPYASPYMANASKTRHQLAKCSSIIRGRRGDTELSIPKPCSGCWFSILATSKTGDSRFTVTMGAEGRWQPLTTGEAFIGHADRNDSAMVFVFDIVDAEARAKVKRGATAVVMTLTPIFGDPCFSVRREAEPTDTQFMFNSQIAGQDVLEIPLNSSSLEKTSGSYFIKVWTRTAHAKFNILVSYRAPKPAIAPATDSAEDLSNRLHDLLADLPRLQEGVPVRGKLHNGDADYYTFEPATDQDIVLSVTALGGGLCRLYVSIVPSHEELANALAQPKEPSQSHMRSPGPYHSNTPPPALPMPGLSTWNARTTDPFIVISTKDPKYRPGRAYAVGVYPNKQVGDVEYSLQFSTRGVLKTLEPGSPPQFGRLRRGEYERYRLAIPESGHHLLVTLEVLSGEADLYIGFNSTVSKVNNNYASAYLGSDSIFVPAHDKAHKRHCNRNVIQRNHECVYFVAAYGFSNSTFKISSLIVEGAPARLLPDVKERLQMPRGAWQFFYFPINKYAKNVLKVHPLTGDPDVYLKVTTSARARHPPSAFANLKKVADLTSFHAAMNETIVIPPAVAERLCPATGGQMCYALAGVYAFSDVLCEVRLHTSMELTPIEATTASPISKPQTNYLPGSQPTTTEQPVTVMQDDGSVEVLDSGEPSTGRLPYRGASRKYVFWQSSHRDDLSIDITSKSACALGLTIEFPPDPDGTIYNRTFKASSMSIHVSHTNSHFRDGAFVLTVFHNGRQGMDQAGPAGAAAAATNSGANNNNIQCDFDIRAHMSSSGRPDEIAFSMLSPGVPMLVSDNRSHYYVYHSRIPSLEKAYRRERCSVRVTSFAGRIKVLATTITDSLRNQSHGEKILKALTSLAPVESQWTKGSSSEYVIKDLHKSCGETLVCQVLVQVRNERSKGQVSDFAIVALDNDRKHAETLLPSVPVHGNLKPANAKLDYQVIVNNPAATIYVRLTCLQAKVGSNCDDIRLSADSRSPMPASVSQRHWVGTKDGSLLELTINPGVETMYSSGGLLGIPSLLHVRVERDKSAGSNQEIDFEIVSVLDSAYQLLYDGAEPVAALAEPSKPVYFLFDSRSSSPLLTVTVDVPFDKMDPHAELVSLYLLDCAGASGKDLAKTGNKKPDLPMVGDNSLHAVEESSAAIGKADSWVKKIFHQLRDPNKVPSAEFYSKKGRLTPSGQLTAFITSDSEGEQCFYRIAVVSNRLRKFEFTIRGHDWHEGAPLEIGKPVFGLVDRKHRFNYEMARSPSGPSDLVVSFEACAGSPEMLAAEHSHNAMGNKYSKHWKKGDGPKRVTASKTRWFEIVENDRTLGSYMIRVEDPRATMDLVPKPTDMLTHEQQGATAIHVQWNPLLFRPYTSGAPFSLLKGVEYEIIYVAADQAITDFTTPCGLYEEVWRGRAKRVYTKNQIEALLTDLDPKTQYLFNVVARKVDTGHAIAYIPGRAYLFDEKLLGRTEKLLKSKKDSDSSEWGGEIPALLIGTLALLVACTRANPSSMCSSCSQWMRPGGERQYEMRSFGAPRGGFTNGGIHSTAGTYMPPSLVGMSTSSYSQVPQH